MIYILDRKCHRYHETSGKYISSLVSWANHVNDSDRQGTIWLDERASVDQTVSNTITEQGTVKTLFVCTSVDKIVSVPVAE